MKDFSFYEQAGLILPGSALLCGALIMFPDLRTFLSSSDGLTIGGLGLFLIVSYPLGHLVAAFGNWLEALVWAVSGGMPTTWVCRTKPGLLRVDQIQRLQTKLKSRLGIDVVIPGMAVREWKGHFGLLYRDVLMSGTPGRIEVFNGNYGLNRGLAVSSALLAIFCLAFRIPDALLWSAALIAVSAVFIFRMCRFGIYFGREVYSRFLLLPDQRPA